MLKVLFVNSRYPPEGRAGPAFSVQHLAEQLVREGDGAEVICRSAGGEAITERLNGVVVHRLPTAWGAEAFDAALRGLMAQSDAQVMHGNILQGFDPAQLGRLGKEAGMRLVHTLREYRFLCDLGTLFDFRRGTNCERICDTCDRARPLVREYIACLDAVVGISRFVLDRHLREGLFAEVARREVIANAFVIEREGSCAAPPHAGQTGRLNLGFLGRVSVEKGLGVLFAEAGRLGDEVGLEVLVAGEVPPDLPAPLARSVPKIKAQFLGFVERAELMRRIDVLVAPSIWHDPLTRVCMEAGRTVGR